MMKAHRIPIALAVFSGAVLTLAGCHAPGKPGPIEERPDEVKDFSALYKQNCAGCHGEQGRSGIAVSLANPVYIAIAGKDAIAKATAEGGPGALMPSFGHKHGGFLTDEQVNILAEGIVQRWGNVHVLNGAVPPSYAATLTGDPAAGKAAFASYCARCHSANANGPLRNIGPVTDPDFLALISDQNLRSTILAGKPDEGMPDWRGFGPNPLTDQQVTDLVAWLSAQRKQAAGQPQQAPQSAAQGEKQ